MYLKSKDINIGDAVAAGVPACPGPAASAPPRVTRGAGLQGITPTVCIDWLTVVGHRDRLHTARSLLESFFGESEQRRGRHFYGQMYRFEGGAELCFDHISDADGCKVDLAGSALCALTNADVMTLIESLRSIGFARCTRIDLAVDWKGPGVELVERFWEASTPLLVKAPSEVQGFRACEQIASSGGGRTVYLGRRGKVGGGLLVRCYDKGAEQKQDANQWHRLEVSYYSIRDRDAAGIVLGALFEVATRVPETQRSIRIKGLAGVQEWEQAAYRLVLGSVDFGQRGPRDHYRRLGVLVRSDWWAEVVGDESVAAIPAREPRQSSLERTRTWLKKAVAPTLATMSRRVGKSITEVLGDLIGEWEAVKNTVSQSVWEYQQWCQGVSQEAGHVGGVIHAVLGAGSSVCVLAGKGSRA